MTTKIITPQEVTLEMLVAGVESNETSLNYPSRFQLVDGKIRYSVKFELHGKWELIDRPTIDEIRQWMMDDSSDGTIWTTPIQETA